MIAFDLAVVTRKLQAITRYLDTLMQEQASLTESAYLEDFRRQLVVERLLHLIVEAAIDINTHVLVGSGNSPPEDYFESFVTMGQLGFISLNLATRLAPSEGLKNRLVHEYDDLDTVIVFQSIRFALELYPEYVKQVQNYVRESQ